MGVSSYFLNGVQKWKFYAHVRSPKGRTIRVQKRGSNFPDEESCIKAYESALYELTFKVARREAQGDTWRELVDRWETHYTFRPSSKYTESTIRDYVAKLRNWTSSWNDFLAKDITSGDVEDMLELARRAGASYKLRCDIKSVVNVVFKYAIDRKLLSGMTVSPTCGVEVLSYAGENKGEKLPLIKNRETIREALEIAERTKHEWHSAWFVGVHTGMRSSELNALRKDKIDLVDEEEARRLDAQIATGNLTSMNYGYIYVHRAWKKRERRNGPTKGQYWRVVPINQELYWFLKEYLPLANWGSDEDGERVFQKFVAWDANNQAAVINNFFVEHGFGKMTFHVLRAVFATQMLVNGVGSATVMKIGGWKDYETMMIYIRMAGVEVAGATGKMSFRKKPQIEHPIAPCAVGGGFEEAHSLGNVVALFPRNK